ncbi:hypothetical protein FRC06_003228 [Ceratobasidium sp. 370]|nr:hypothetical protein FRC06_003228 [Ceratobasidium sp. 370]
MDALPDGVDVKHSLNNWKMYRAQLATTIQGYLAACADLGSVCARASRRTYDRKDLESALVDIDAELESLASEAESLGSAKTSLAVTRNLSTTLAPIHALPPEVLTRIFMRLPTRQFTGISSYWRWVGLTTASLWTYLDIADQTEFSYEYLSLERSGGLPLYFYVDAYCPEDQSHRFRQLDFFSDAMPQIGILVIDTHIAIFDRTAKDMLEIWLDNSFVKTTKALRVLLRIDVVPHSIPRWDLDLLSLEHAEAVLSALTVLHLKNNLIPFSSAAYHNLADLRLLLTVRCSHNGISVSQLAGIFAASPGLSTLKLQGLEVVPSSDWDAIKVTPLIHLEVLCLLDMDDESLELVMRLVPLSRCLGELSIGLNAGDNILPIAQDFLRGSRTKKLACTMHHGSDSIWWPLLLSKVVPLLEHLVIVNFTPRRAPNMEDLVLDLERHKGEGGLNEEFPSYAPHVYLASCTISQDVITLIARVLGAQTIHLGRCYMMDDRGKLVGLDVTLLEALPSIVCPATMVDTTARWPCRTMFDRSVIWGNVADAASQ